MNHNHAQPRARARARARSQDEAAGSRRRRRVPVIPMLAAVRLLAVRTARRDVGLLAAWFLVVALAVAVAVGGPRLATGVLDRAAREAVADAGRAADVTATLGGMSVNRAMDYRAEALAEIQLPVLRSVIDGTELAITGSGYEVSSVTSGESSRTPTELALRLALLDSGDARSRVRVVDGELPPEKVAEPPAPVPVVLPVAAAEARDLEVGDVLRLPGRPAAPAATPPPPVDVVVVGLVEPLDESDLVWADAGTLWSYERGDAVPMLATPAGASSIDLRLGGHWTAVLRFVVDPDRFDSATATRAVPELDELAVHVDQLLSQLAQYKAVVRTDLPDVLDEYAAAARSAAAQMSMPTVGAAGTVALVLILLARLVVDRRRSVLELERARGAAVGTIVLRLGLEALVVTGLAAGAALAALHWLLPGETSGVGLSAVLAAAVLASPAWGGLLARRAWSGSRVPANRRDRARLVRRRAGARVVGELAVLALAAAAAVALRRRGLLQTTTLSADPFLGAAPLLIALVAAVLALRLYPWPVRAVGLLARRSRGPLGVVGASRAQRALEPLPLLVLTLAVAVGVSGLLVVGTIRAGQVRASWDVVAADASVTAPDVGPMVDDLTDAPGVTAVSAARVVTGAKLDLGNRDAAVTVLAVDAAYARTVAGLPGAGDDLAALDELPHGTIVPRPERGQERPTVAAVISPDLAERIGPRGVSVWVSGARTTLDVIGTTDHAPLGSGPGPFVFLALGTLTGDEGPLTPTVAWVRGPGAADAATAAVAEADLPADAAVVTAQATVLAEGRADPLVEGVERTLLAGAGIAGVLAAVGALATALAGARERGRTLALLRTLGMRPRLGWWLAGVELAPVVLAALVAGAAAATAVVDLLGTSMGLDVLVGGVGTPPVAVDGSALVGVAVGAVALLVVAVAVDAIAHRRARLADVLRVGETPGS